MRFWFDTEFIEDGRTIDLISIGVVAEDGRTYYAEAVECDLTRASPWVEENVFPHLTGARIPREQIAREIVAFCGEKPELWAYYADYDWVALCQLFGRMIDLPKGWPMFCRDVKQLAASLGNPVLHKQVGAEHNALADAQWAREATIFLEAFEPTGMIVAEIRGERRRQIASEGWSIEHDDAHTKGELARAAAKYAGHAGYNDRVRRDIERRLHTQSDATLGGGWFKPKGRRSDLVRAGALIVAEIERLDRLEAKGGAK